MTRVKIMLALLGWIGSVKTVEVHPGLPPFEVRVIPAPAPSAEVGNSPHRIARVEIYRRGRSKPLQTLEVTGYGTPFYLQFSRFEDANFDGYADLLIGNDGGAKWSGYQVFLYDPASGTFVENALSHELSEHLGGQELEFHRLDGEIEVSHLVFGCQSTPVIETFEVKDSHLRQVQRQDLVREEDGCYRVTRRLLDGGLKEIDRQRAPERDGGD